MSERGYTRSDPPLSTLLRNLGGLFLGRDAAGAAMRLLTIGGLLAVYWFFLAMGNRFQGALPAAWLQAIPVPLNLILDFLSSFFSPAVLLGLLPVLAALWLALRVGAHYMTDLFELETPSIAMRHLRASLLGLGYRSLEISSGDRQMLDLSNPLVRIGGPGRLTVHLGFASVFESAEGRPKVYGPSTKRFIGGFERLRDVVDLRDQLHKVDEVRAVTRDGIEIFARDAQMMFRVYSGGRARSLQDPYPYTEDAVRHLVYGQAVSAIGPRKWTDLLSALVRAEIREFVSGLTIEEFLALQHGQVSDEELDEEGYAERATQMHIPRRQLTDRFHTEQTRQRLMKSGLEVAWVGVGTWEIRSPAPAEEEEPSAGQTLISAWRDMQRTQLYRSPQYLARQRSLGYESVTSGMLREVVALWQESEGEDTQARRWALLAHGFNRHLQEMLRMLASEGEGRLPSNFRSAAEHVRRLVQPEHF
jgi:hypothetical protein